MKSSEPQYGDSVTCQHHYDIISQYVSGSMSVKDFKL